MENFTSYPEGWSAVAQEIDFLPEGIDPNMMIAGTLAILLSLA